MQRLSPRSRMIGALAGMLLVAGLWTPFAGVVAACAEAWSPFSFPAHPAIPAALAVLGLTLALIGPGEWSVHARLYGRKHYVPPRLYDLEHWGAASNGRPRQLLRPWQNRDRTLRIDGIWESFERKADSPSC